jgi:UDP-2,3-diacylglucosamine pyrophosphatase LpxH
MDKTLNIKLDLDVKLLCVSDIHEHPDQFFEIVNKFPISEKMRLVVCGDIFDKGYGFSAAEKIINKLKYHMDLGQAYFIKGNHELKNIKKSRQAGSLSPLMKWVDNQPISLSFIYNNSSRYTVVHGGVDGYMGWDDLVYDLSVCYIRYLSNSHKKMIPIKKEQKDGLIVYTPKDPENSLWHEVYDGRFGYIISGHNSNPSGPNFYKYSCNIDTGVFDSGKLTAAIFSSKGREEIYQAIGKAYKDEQVIT